MLPSQLQRYADWGSLRSAYPAGQPGWRRTAACTATRTTTVSTAILPAVGGALCSSHTEPTRARADKDVAGKYMTAFFYTGEYEEWQKGHIARLLRLTPRCRLVDIGGGTGRFAQLLREACGLEQEALCVDPSAGMLEQAAKIPGIRTECAGGLEFSQKADESYDRALVKEVVHHLPDEELRQMFHGIFAQLQPGGICLTCTRPHVVQYPFFDAALEVWKRQQPPMEHYVSIMEEAGFEVSCEVCDYPATLGVEWWLEMVQNRFWSTFSHFSDEELAAGIAEIRERYCQAGADTISFTEQMVFISASKPDSAAVL